MKSTTVLRLICSTTLSFALLATAQAGPGGRGRAPAPKRGDNDRGDRTEKREEKKEENKEGGKEYHGGTWDPGVNHRQENQEDRIHQGVHSGQLTREETQELANTEKGIRKEEKEYKSDGTLTKDERKDLHQDLNSASKEIYKEKHDAETQPGVTPAEPRKYSTKDPGVNGRQENQQDRIQQGVKSGELTKKEAFTIEQKEARLAQLEKRLKEDGTLTPEERARLQKRLDGISANIYKQKHDAQEQK